MLALIFSLLFSSNTEKTSVQTNAFRSHESQWLNLEAAAQHHAVKMLFFSRDSKTVQGSL